MLSVCAGAKPQLFDSTVPRFIALWPGYSYQKEDVPFEFHLSETLLVSG